MNSINSQEDLGPVIEEASTMSEILSTPKQKNIQGILHPLSFSSSSSQSYLTPKRPAKKKNFSQYHSIRRTNPNVNASPSGIHEYPNFKSSSLSSSLPSSPKPRPKLSPSRFLCASMAVIHHEISHSFTSSSEEGYNVLDYNSLVLGNDGIDIDAGLEVVLNHDQSLSYQEC